MQYNIVSTSRKAIMYRYLMPCKLRLMIIDMLFCGEMCASDILKEVTITQATLSYHMKILTESGLVNATRDGAWMRYTLNKDKTNEVLSFFVQISNDKKDCVCKTKLNKNGDV